MTSYYDEVWYMPIGYFDLMHKLVDTHFPLLYLQIEIEDMDFDEDEQVYTYPCPCGDKFEIFVVSEGILLSRQLYWLNFIFFGTCH